jgi:hypothetical protein
MRMADGNTIASGSPSCVTYPSALGKVIPIRWVFVFALLAGTLGIVAIQLRAPASPKFSEHHVIGERASLKVPFYGCAIWRTRAG